MREYFENLLGHVDVVLGTETLNGECFGYVTTVWPPLTVDRRAANSGRFYEQSLPIGGFRRIRDFVCKQFDRTTVFHCNSNGQSRRKFKRIKQFPAIHCVTMLILERQLSREDR